MHRYLVCSDIHRNMDNFVTALEDAYGEGVEGVIIAGDTEMDPDVIREMVHDADADLYIVKGNCDYGYDLMDHVTFKLPDGLTCFLTHGHRYGVKSDLYTLASVADNLGADVAIYGHTHIYDDSMMGKVRVINPGSLNGGCFSQASYILMTVYDGKIDIVKKVIGVE